MPVPWMKGGSVVGVVATAVGVRRQRRLEDRGAATACRAWLVDNTEGSGRMPDRAEVRCYAGSRAGDPFSIPPQWLQPRPDQSACPGNRINPRHEAVSPASELPALLLVRPVDRPIVRTCFCMFYRKTGTGTGVGLENRQAMKALVDRGTVPGLIGYENGVPVAWVSLGPREDYAKLRRSPLMKPVVDRPVWSIVCFFVDRRARGRGLSERMLRAAVDYARSCGARLVEAYPVDRDERSHPDFMFFGAKSMYDRAGFREVARRRPTRPVVRKALRPGSSATGP